MASSALSVLGLDERREQGCTRHVEYARVLQSRAKSVGVRSHQLHVFLPRSMGRCRFHFSTCIVREVSIRDSTPPQIATTARLSRSHGRDRCSNHAHAQPARTGHVLSAWDARNEHVYTLVGEGGGTTTLDDLHDRGRKSVEVDRSLLDCAHRADAVLKRMGALRERVGARL